MVNDNTPSPKRRRKRKVEKPRVTPKRIEHLKDVVRLQKLLRKKPLPPRLRELVERIIAEGEQWIKAYGG